MYKTGEKVEVSLKVKGVKEWIPARIIGHSTFNEPCVELLLHPQHPAMKFDGHRRLIKGNHLIRK